MGLETQGSNPSQLPAKKHSGNYRFNAEGELVDSKGNPVDASKPAEKKNGGILPPPDIQLSYYLKYKHLRAEILKGRDGELQFKDGGDAAEKVRTLNLFFNKDVAWCDSNPYSGDRMYKVHLKDAEISALFDIETVRREEQKLTNKAA